MTPRERLADVLGVIFERAVVTATSAPEPPRKPAPPEPDPGPETPEEVARRQPSRRAHRTGPWWEPYAEHSAGRSRPMTSEPQEKP